MVPSQQDQPQQSFSAPSCQAHNKPAFLFLMFRVFVGSMHAPCMHAPSPLQVGKSWFGCFSGPAHMHEAPFDTHSTCMHAAIVRQISWHAYRLLENARRLSFIPSLVEEQ